MHKKLISFILLCSTMCCMFHGAAACEPTYEDIKPKCVQKNDAKKETNSGFRKNISRLLTGTICVAVPGLLALYFINLKNKLKFKMQILNKLLTLSASEIKSDRNILNKIRNFCSATFPDKGTECDDWLVRDEYLQSVSMSLMSQLHSNDLAYFAKNEIKKIRIFICKDWLEKNTTESINECSNSLFEETTLDSITNLRKAPEMLNCSDAQRAALSDFQDSMPAAQDIIQFFNKFDEN